MGGRPLTADWARNLASNNFNRRSLRLPGVHYVLVSVVSVSVIPAPRWPDSWDERIPMDRTGPRALFDKRPHDPPEAATSVSAGYRNPISKLNNTASFPAHDRRN